MLDNEFLPMRMPELSTNLVDKNGIPTKELEEIYNDNEKKIKFNDKLLDWISSNS
jgi:hypothetical protein